ncbi:MAG: CBS domain-containing protein [Gammaproteobacteria bacterium]|nr:MAG: CBS domain-containing protein [Gammaproteobacteria bacterium]
MSHNNERRKITVADIMKDKYELVDGMMSVSDAIAILQNIAAKALVVNKKDENDEFGIISLSDISHKVLASDKSVDRTQVYEIMTKPAFCIKSTMDIRYAARMFEQFNISRAPVMEAGCIVGMVSITDMVLKGLTKNNL